MRVCVMFADKRIFEEKFLYTQYLISVRCHKSLAGKVSLIVAGLRIDKIPMRDLNFFFLLSSRDIYVESRHDDNDLVERRSARGRPTNNSVHYTADCVKI